MKKTKIKEANKKIIYLSLALIFLVVLLINLFNNKSNSNQNKYTGNRQNCLADDCLLVDNLDYPVGTLPQKVQDALDQAINDEYKAYTTYEAVIKKFGNIKPFSMIIRAEEQHISSLKSIYDKYGATIPENKLKVEDISLPSTVKEICQIGVDAEIANANLYKDKLLPEVKSYEDISNVFINLMNASTQKHLPAFENCN